MGNVNDELIAITFYGLPTRLCDRYDPPYLDLKFFIIIGQPVYDLLRIEYYPRD